MKLNAFNVSTYQYTPQNTTFKGQNRKVATPKPATNPLKRVAPWVFSGLLMIGGGACSNNENRVSDLEKFNDINVEYTDVTTQTRDSVMTPVYELKSKLTPENDFLKGVKVNIARSFEELPNTDSFTKYVRENESDINYKGTSFFSDSLIQKRIAVQERAFSNNGEIYKPMRQTLMHEVGHHFDNFFGHDHKADFALKWDSIMNAHDKSPESDLFTFRTVNDEANIERYFYAHNALSDKEEFQNALFHDLCDLSQKKELPENIDYYLDNINLKKGLSREKLKRADRTRSEIYANLFSYLSGQDDGHKEKFLECFENSSKIVKKDMQKFLKFVK